MDWAASCSSGLHASTPFYTTEGDTLIAVKVELADVITCQEGKVRCKALTVIGEVKPTRRESKTCVLKVICNNCLQDKECVGTGGDGRWLCEDCAKRLEFKNKSDCLIQAGWIATPNVNKKLKFRVEVHASVSRIYEVEAEDEEIITMKGIWSMKMRITKTLIRFA